MHGDTAGTPPLWCSGEGNAAVAEEMGGGLSFLMSGLQRGEEAGRKRGAALTASSQPHTSGLRPC